MSYKTTVVHADLSRHAPARIGIAAQLAKAHDAHLPAGGRMQMMNAAVFAGPGCIVLDRKPVPVAGRGRPLRPCRLR